MFELYHLLQVKPSASQNEIHKSFRRLAKATHPDLNDNDSAKQDLFRKIKEAYDTLSNPEKRKQYDESQKQAQHPQPTYRSPAEIKERFLTLFVRKLVIKARMVRQFFALCVLSALIYGMMHVHSEPTILRFFTQIRIKPSWVILALLLCGTGIIIALIAECGIILSIKHKIKKLMKEGK